jgi:hypothetical protein
MDCSSYFVQRIPAVIRADMCARFHHGRYGTNVYGPIIIAASASHDMNGDDSPLIPRKQVIHKRSGNGMRFTAELCHHPANQDPGCAMPLQINGAVCTFRAVNFSPTVWSTESLVLGRN